MAEFRLLGVPEFRAAIDAHVARQLVATRVAVGKAAHLIEEKAKLQLTSSSHRAGTPTPSRPGSPPSLVTGLLRRSVSVTGPTALTATSFTASAGPTAVYGRIQELGGVTGRGGTASLPARPYMEPAMTAAEPEVQALFREAWSTW